MSTELQKVIRSFCQLIPENKIGEYSSNALDDKRLKLIYDTAILIGEDIRPQHIIDCLKECHPNIADEVIVECADSAFKHMLTL